uniref:Putative tpa exp: ubiquinol cytochrome c reductase subunit qcr7 n=1 Tax=Ixodes ricinus TaxID=34613 RepID=A0A0K8RM48_IXORI
MSYKQITNTSWGRFLFNQRKYYQFGLLHDDLYKSNDVVIDEAVTSDYPKERIPTNEDDKLPNSYRS